MNRTINNMPRILVALMILCSAVSIGGSQGVQPAQSASADSETKLGDLQIKEPPYTPKSKSQLRKQLTSMQYRVTQNADTEKAFRNKYWDNKKQGIYRCIVCGQSLFSSTTKFKSGTGWPSFDAPIKKDHVGYKTDYFLFYPRTEVHCGRCKAHLGHVFDDGPRQTTGKRFCMNSASLNFVSKEDLEKEAKEKNAK